MMKRFFLCAAVAFLATAPSWGQFRTPLEDLDDSETVRALKEHVAYLSAAQLEGRKAGSEGERMAAEYLEEQLRACGVDVLGAGNTFGIAGGKDTLTSRNVMGLLQGWDKQQSQHYIVVGARMDNLGTDTLTVNGEKQVRLYAGANGNASGMALLVELARKLSYSRSLIRRSILFVGFGSSCESFAGSWYFLNRAFAADAAQIDAMVNLDMLGTAENGFWAYTASNGDLNTILQSLQGELLPVQAQLTTQQPYPGDHIVFYDKEIPETMSCSTTRKFLPSCSLRAVIRSMVPDGIRMPSSTLRAWKKSWSIFTATSSAWPMAPARFSGTRLPPRRPSLP